MPRFETPRLQMAVFQTVITVASGLSLEYGGKKRKNVASILKAWQTFHFLLVWETSCHIVLSTLIFLVSISAKVCHKSFSPFYIVL